MSIKSATRLAITCIAIALVMSFIGRFLFMWLMRGDILNFTAATMGTIQNAYYAVLAILRDGSLLVFLFALYSRQKDQA